MYVIVEQMKNTEISAAAYFKNEQKMFARDSKNTSYTINKQ